MNVLDAEKLANRLIQHFKDKGEITKRWSFKWSRAKTYYGMCDFSNYTIHLSKHFVEIAPEADVKDTILHEIAHAIAGPDAGHGPSWKKVARQIGAKPDTCKPAADGLKAKYKSTCDLCGAIYYFYRSDANLKNRICSRKVCDAKRLGRILKWKEM